MSRKNDKKISVDYENSIKKSNEISMAKLNQGLSLNQMQLLAYAIFSTQQDGKTQFRKFEFQNKFSIKKYQTKHAKEDVKRILDLKFSIEDLENDYFEYWNVFSSIRYKDGLFNFKWNEEFIPHILELKEKYVTTDLTITSKFNSGFSWILYDYLKAHYGYWNIKLSKNAGMRLFGVESKKTYQNNTGRFKGSVLDIAINEINRFTELEVWYTEMKEGRSIVGFELHWSTGQRETGATDKQLALLRDIHDEVDKNMFDYISVKNANSLETARTNIMKIKEINEKVNKTLTSEKAKILIWESRTLYEQLQNLIKQDGKERDTSVYFNWLNDDDM